jgi:hypothetical protein
MRVLEVSILLISLILLLELLRFFFSLYYFNIPVPYQFDFLSGSNIRLINENANRKILPAHSKKPDKISQFT